MTRGMVCSAGPSGPGNAVQLQLTTEIFVGVPYFSYTWLSSAPASTTQSAQENKGLRNVQGGGIPHSVDVHVHVHSVMLNWKKVRGGLTSKP